MKTWFKLLAVVALLGLTLAEEVKGEACDVDDPEMRRRDALRLFNTKFANCAMDVVSEETKAEMKEAKSLTDIQRLTSGFCTHAPQVATCLASVRASYETCHNKNVSVPILVNAHMIEHLLPGACENEGERLAHLVRAVKQYIEAKDSMIPLRRCMAKANSLLQAAEDMDIDIVLWTYLLYKEQFKFKNCIQQMEDEASKPAVEWLSNELLSTLKCQHPEEDRLVLCSDIEEAKVPTISICKTEPFDEPNLYDFLENVAIGCYTLHFSHDTNEMNNSTSLEDLKKEYKHLCGYYKNTPDCLLRYSGFAESCLSQEEDKQFQLFAQSIEDFTERSCEDEGEWIATVMHEVYRQTPEHGNAWRDCYNQDTVESRSKQDHAFSSKNMRFYHEIIAFKQCVVGKLHDNNDVSKGVERMINDVLKKMKCVGPEDGTPVLCETIHDH